MAKKRREQLPMWAQWVLVLIFAYFGLSYFNDRQCPDENGRSHTLCVISTVIEPFR